MRCRKKLEFELSQNQKEAIENLTSKFGSASYTHTDEEFAPTEEIKEELPGGINKFSEEEFASFVEENNLCYLKTENEFGFGEELHYVEPETGLFVEFRLSDGEYSINGLTYWDKDEGKVVYKLLKNSTNEFYTALKQAELTEEAYPKYLYQLCGDHKAMLFPRTDDGSILDYNLDWCLSKLKMLPECNIVKLLKEFVQKKIAELEPECIDEIPVGINVIRQNVVGDGSYSETYLRIDRANSVSVDVVENSGVGPIVVHTGRKDFWKNWKRADSVAPELITFMREVLFNCTNTEFVEKTVDGKLTAGDLESVEFHRYYDSEFKSLYSELFSLHVDAYFALDGFVSLSLIKERDRELQGKKEWRYGGLFDIPLLVAFDSAGIKVNYTKEELLKQLEGIGDIFVKLREVAEPYFYGSDKPYAEEFDGLITEAQMNVLNLESFVSECIEREESGSVGEVDSDSVEDRNAEGVIHRLMQLF